MIRISLAAVLFVLFALPALAQDPSIDCSNAITQADMDRCASRQYWAADAELNQVYKQVMAAMQPKDQDALRQAQRAWIRNRDQQCTASSKPAEGGSMQPLLIINCVTQWTISRTAELKKMMPPSGK
ncbi:lysozyme inhibitor LprI family protein [Brucella endophytica]|nr:lysozyme inhibitor LprI family protein [Brucella endophytica]